MSMRLFLIAFVVFPGAHGEDTLQADLLQHDIIARKPLLALTEMLLAPSPMTSFAPNLAPRTRSSPAIRSFARSRPQHTMLAPAPLEEAMILLAKSDADKLIDEAFISFPLIITGGIIGGFAGEVAAGEGLLDEKLSLAAIPATMVLFVILAKLGVLGAASGIVAKVALDLWNLFAGVVLPGAILKY